MSNIGDLLIDLFTGEGFPVRWRRLVPTENADGSVNLYNERILGLEDDRLTILQAISQRKSVALFGGDIQCETIAIVKIETAALVIETDQLKVMGGAMAGRTFEVMRRKVDQGAQLGGAVTLGLSAPGPGRSNELWD